MSQGFQFKQFTIRHDRCAMKVGTDSILLGSWVKPDGAQHILDIGTGSGLLAIMLAQKSPSTARLTGIDIDADAINQACENAGACPWSRQLNFINVALQDYVPPQPLDLIISNPPYFVPGQRFDAAREAARHTGRLSHSQLLMWVSEHLTGHGRFACVLPMDSGEVMLEQASGFGLSLSRRLDVHTVSDKPPGRLLLELVGSDVAVSPKRQQLTIYDSGAQYSQAYRQLCRDYYLNF